MGERIMKRPTAERSTDLILRGAGGGSIGILLFAWYWILATDGRTHPHRHAIALLPFVVLLGAIGGGVMGLLICLCEYAFQQTTCVIVRSLIGVCCILILEWFVGMFTLKDALSIRWLNVDWVVHLILLGVLPAGYAGVFAKPSVQWKPSS
jgi:hypothetical protein